MPSSGLIKWPDEKGTSIHSLERSSDFNQGPSCSTWPLGQAQGNEQPDFSLPIHPYPVGRWLNPTERKNVVHRDQPRGEKCREEMDGPWTRVRKKIDWTQPRKGAAGLITQCVFHRNYWEREAEALFFGELQVEHGVWTRWLKIFHLNLRCCHFKVAPLN